MENKNNVVSLDKINIIEKIDELNTTLEHIENSVKEISESKENVIESVINTQQNTNLEIKINETLNVFEGAHSSQNDLYLLLNFLQNNNQVVNLMNKLSLIIDRKTQGQLENVLKFLTTNNIKFDSSPPIKNIIDEIKKVFSDGKLDLYDIPALINIVANIIKLDLANLKINFDNNLIGLIIKFIVHALIELKIIKTIQQENNSIDKLIDSSILLLKTTMTISNVKCSFFSCCKK
jgi:sulfur relay (sulfurtransferase) DsrC/TusE family protein